MCAPPKIRSSKFPPNHNSGHETGPDASSRAETLGIRSCTTQGPFPTPPGLPRVENVYFSRVSGFFPGFPPGIQPQVVTGSMVLAALARGLNQNSSEDDAQCLCILATIGGGEVLGPGLVPAWSRLGPGLVPAWLGPGLVPAWSRLGPGLGPWSRLWSLVPAFL